MVRTSSKLISNLDFQAACRRYPMSTLVSDIAKRTAGIGLEYGSPKNPTNLWGYAAIARTALLHGTDFRDQVVDDRAITKLLRMQSNLISGDDLASPDILFRVATALAHDQIPFQENVRQSLARSKAWIVDGLNEVETVVLNETSLTEMLDGLSLQETIGATFVLQGGAFMNEGLFDSGWVDQGNFVEILKFYPRENIEKVARRLTTTIDSLRSENAENSGLVDGRFRFNPLLKTPFVDLGDGKPIAPIAQYVFQTATPNSLFYLGMERFGQKFSIDLGNLFENYIGRQLKQIEAAEVYSEVEYAKGAHSIDWFVVLPDVVLLFEVKSKRPNADIREARSMLGESMHSAFEKPCRQLARTLELIDERHQSFENIPHDRPMAGIIVTSEPYYTGTAHLLSEGLAPLKLASGKSIPVGIMSAQDVENLVNYSADELSGIVLEQIAKGSGKTVESSSVPMKPDGSNKILDDAWDQYTWLDPHTD